MPADEGVYYIDHKVYSPHEIPGWIKWLFWTVIIIVIILI